MADWLRDYPRKRLRGDVIGALTVCALFFGNINRIKTAILEAVSAAHPSTVILDLSASYRLSIPVLDTRLPPHHPGPTARRPAPRPRAHRRHRDPVRPSAGTAPGRESTVADALPDPPEEG